MRTFVLSGATGFLGGRLAAALLARGDAVLAVVRSEAAAQRLRARHPGAALRAVMAAPDTLEPVLAGALAEPAAPVAPAAAINAACADPAGVIHAAACYGRHGEPDAALHEANVALPRALFAWAARRRAAGFVLADTVLAAAAGRYAASKAQGRQQLRVLAAGAPLPMLDLRLEHLYGPGDAADRFVPWLAAACRDAGSAVALSGGAQRREFVHVDDAVDAMLRLLDALPRLRPGWHGTRVSGEPTSVRALAEAVHALTASRATLAFGARPDRPAEADPDAPDDGLLRRLGWTRRIPLAEGLRQTVLEGIS
jgi:nucleoside-diphosphate-sugar epimerase